VRRREHRPWSRVWRVLSCRWSGPAQLRRISGRSVVAELAGAGRTGSVWAAGYTARDGLIALHRPVPDQAG
jgi:hypothetical protein